MFCQSRIHGSSIVEKSGIQKPGSRIFSGKFMTIFLKNGTLARKIRKRNFAKSCATENLENTCEYPKRKGPHLFQSSKRNLLEDLEKYGGQPKKDHCPFQAIKFGK